MRVVGWLGLRGKSGPLVGAGVAERAGLWDAAVRAARMRQPVGWFTVRGRDRSQDQRRQPDEIPAPSSNVSRAAPDDSPLMF